VTKYSSAAVIDHSSVRRHRTRALANFSSLFRDIRCGAVRETCRPLAHYSPAAAITIRRVLLPGFGEKIAPVLDDHSLYPPMMVVLKINGKKWY
jgi:hypothetical protein